MPSKNHRIPFYADECIPLPSVSFLRKRGVRISHAYEEGLIQQDDFSVHLKHSKKLGKVLLSLDKDFRKLDGTNLSSHPGVILITVGTAVSENINRVLAKVLENITEDYVKNSLIRITISKITRVKKDKVDSRNI